MEQIQSTVKILFRRRFFNVNTLNFEPLLNLIDLISLGIAPTFGTGIFVILTYVSKYQAGPSSALSFLIAAVASCLGGFCLTELATRFPKIGPSYVYVYLTLGELPAFLLAWSMHLEYAFASALSLRSFVQYFLFFFNQNQVSNTKEISKNSEKNLIKLFSPYSTFFITSVNESSTYKNLNNKNNQFNNLTTIPSTTIDDLKLSVFLIFFFIVIFIMKTRGTKIACFINNLFVFFSLIMLTGLLLVCTIYFVHIDNWTKGNEFFSNGIHGVFNGAAICFFSFIGYDLMCLNLIKCKNFERILPTAISLNFLIGLLTTFLCAIVYTLSAPLHLQNTFASFSQLFIGTTLFKMQYVIVLISFFVSVSTILSLIQANNLLLIHLASDGLLPKIFSDNLIKCNEKNYQSYKKTPFLTSLATFLFFICVAISFNNDSLIGMLGVGTLLNYAFAALTVLLLRYNHLKKLPLEVNRKIFLDNDLTSINDFTTKCEKCSFKCEKCLLRCDKCSDTKKIIENNLENFDSINKDKFINNQPWQLIVALPTSYYYKQYHKRTFDKIKKSFSEFDLQNKLKSIQSLSFTKFKNQFQNIDENIIYEKKNYFKNFVNLDEDSSNKFVDNYDNFSNEYFDHKNSQENVQLTSSFENDKFKSLLEFNFNLNYSNKSPTVESEKKVNSILLRIVLLMVLMGLCTSQNDQLLWFLDFLNVKPSFWLIESSSCIFSCAIIYHVILLSRQPLHLRILDKNTLPCVPLLPVCALWMNIHLVLCLSCSAWITFLIWLLTGIFVYMSYSVWNSKETSSNDFCDLDEENQFDELENFLDDDEISNLSY